MCTQVAAAYTYVLSCEVPAYTALNLLECLVIKASYLEIADRASVLMDPRQLNTRVCTVLQTADVLIDEPTKVQVAMDISKQLEAREADPEQIEVSNALCYLRRRAENLREKYVMSISSSLTCSFATLVPQPIRAPLLKTGSLATASEKPSSCTECIVHMAQ